MEVNVELAKALSSLPLTVLLVLVLVGGYTGWWIYGSIHRARVEELERERDLERTRGDKWEDRYLKHRNDLHDVRDKKEED